MSKHDGKILVYKDASTVKRKNRRIQLEKAEDEGCYICFVRIDGSLHPRSLHSVVKGKAVVTTIKLSKDGLEDLRDLINVELNRL